MQTALQYCFYDIINSAESQHLTHFDFILKTFIIFWRENNDEKNK